MINRHVSTCYFLIAVLFSGCNSVKEPQPDPPSEEIPQEVASNVYNLFPRATGMVARTFIRDKVWKVNFKQDELQFISVLNRTQHLAHAKLLDEQVPETLRRITDSQLIQGGTYTNFREDDSSPGYPQQFCAEYHWNNQNFTIRWVNSVDDWSSFDKAIYMFPETELTYYSSYEELPDKIQSLLKPRYFQPGGAKVYVRNGIPSVFAVGGQSTSLSYNDMLIDDTGKVFFSMMGNIEYYNALDEFPKKVRDCIKNNTAYASMVYRYGLRFEDGPFGGYRVDLTPAQVMLSRQEVNLYFDKDGNLVETYFTALFRQ